MLPERDINIIFIHDNDISEFLYVIVSAQEQAARAAAGVVRLAENANGLFALTKYPLASRLLAVIVIQTCCGWRLLMAGSKLKRRRFFNLALVSTLDRLLAEQ